MNQNDSIPTASLPLMDSRRLRDCLGSFGTGVTVVTTCTRDGMLRGITANSFSSVSLDPPLVLWSISNRAQSFAAFMACEKFAVNVLAADQIDLAQRFAASGGEKFRGLDYHYGSGGVPLLSCCTARFECSTAHRYGIGDHVIIVGQVQQFEHSDRPGLLFVAGRFCSVPSTSIAKVGSAPS